MGRWVLSMTLIALLALFASVSAARAGEGDSPLSHEGFYVGVFLVIFSPQDSDVDNGVTFGEVSYETGAGLGVAVGYRYDNGLRLEGELSARAADLDEFQSSGSGSSNLGGDLVAASVLVNGYYDFHNRSIFTPYVGVGLGLTAMESGDIFSSGDDTVGTFQLSLGGYFHLARNLDLDVSYRYLTTDDAQFGRWDYEFAASNLQVGLLFKF